MAWDAPETLATIEAWRGKAKAAAAEEKKREAYEAQGVKVDGQPLTKLRGKRVWLYHGTSDKFVKKILTSGIAPGTETSNWSNFGSKKRREGVQPHVFLTANDGGLAASAGDYAMRAAYKHGGHAVVLRVLVDADELSYDPDDRDLPVGRNQFVIDRVSPSEIMEVDGKVIVRKGRK